MGTEELKNKLKELIDNENDAATLEAALTLLSKARKYHQLRGEILESKPSTPEPEAPEEDMSEVFKRLKYHC